MAPMKISLIAAVAKNRVIGRRGRLPWKIPADLKHFKKVTMGKPIIMGRKTYQSIGVELPGRTSIVVTRNPAIGAPGLVVAGSVHQALQKAARIGPEAMVIGGGQIETQATGFQRREQNRRAVVTLESRNHGRAVAGGTVEARECDIGLIEMGLDEIQE